MLYMASPVNFGVRNFATTLKFKENGKVLYVSAIGPTLFVVPVDDVRSAERNLGEDTLRRSSIRIFSRGNKIAIKGVHRFPDEDHCVVFSSRFLAVVHGEELKDVFKREIRADDYNVLCSSRTIEMPNGVEIVDLQCLKSGKILIVCKTTLIIGILRKDKDNKFSIDIGQQTMILNDIVCGETGKYVEPLPTLGEIRSCCFIGDTNAAAEDRPMKLIFNTASEYMGFLNFTGTTGVNLHTSKVDTQKACNMITPLTNNGAFGFITDMALGKSIVDEGYLEILQRSTDGETDIRTLFSATVERTCINWNCRKDFICSLGNDLMLLNKGSVQLHDYNILPSFQRFDIVCSGDLTYLSVDDENKRMIVTGSDSNWICMKTIEKKMSIVLPTCCDDSGGQKHFVIAFRDTVYKFSENSRAHAHKFENGKLSRKHTRCGGRMRDDDFAISAIRPSLQSSKVRRAIMYSNKGLVVFDFDQNQCLVELSCEIGKALWATPLGTDTLAMAPDGHIFVISDVLKFVFLCKPIVDCCDREELNRKLMVRRLTRGNARGLLFAYENQLKHVVYQVPCTVKPWEEAASVAKVQSIFPYHLQGTRSVSKEDSIHIADMLLEVGGSLTILLRNGTIILYQLDINTLEKCLNFEFISSRRVEVVGQQLFRAPQGLRVLGIINAYVDGEDLRLCADEMGPIDDILTRKEGEALLALIDPYTSQVLATFETGTVGTEADAFKYIDHHEITVIADFTSNLMSVAFVNPHNNSETTIIPRKILAPVNLTKHTKPPGRFRGIVSTKLEEGFYVVAACFLNIHMYILDTETGSFNEMTVYGWDSDPDSLTLTQCSNDHMFLMVRAQQSFTLLDLKVLRHGDFVGLEVIPLCRIVPDGKYADKTGEITFDNFRSGADSFPLFVNQSEKRQCSNIIRKTSYKKDNDPHDVYLGVYPQQQSGQCGIHFKQLLELRQTKFPRQFIQIPTSTEIVVAEGCRKGVMFHHGFKTNLEQLESPIVSLSPLAFYHIQRKAELFQNQEVVVHEEKIVCTAAIDGKHQVWLFLMGVTDDGCINRLLHPIVLPFPKIELSAKLFLRLTYNGTFLLIYVYRLKKGSNVLEVVRVQCFGDHLMRAMASSMPKKMRLPDIFLETDGIEDLEAFDIHFVNEEYLFTNDGPRMIRVCQCSLPLFQGTDHGDNMPINVDPDALAEAYMKLIWT